MATTAIIRTLASMNGRRFATGTARPTRKAISAMPAPPR